MNTEIDRLNCWFAGNVDAYDLYRQIVQMTHIWDDLIDKDREVSENEIHNVFGSMLFSIPSNPFYRKFEVEIRALIYTGAVSYQAANLMERSRDGHQLELAHYLRYVITTVGAFMIGVLNGTEAAPKIIASAMPVMIPERIDDYLKEHANAN